MTFASTKLLCTATVLGLGALAATGCGNDVPPNAVATVNDAVIKKSEFEKWLGTAQASASQGAKPVSYEPPDYSKCVAAKKAQPVPKGQEQSEAALKKQCKQEYEQLKKQVMQFLVQAQWVEQEAKAQDIKISDAQVKKSFEDQKKQAFPTDKAYQQFLKTSGMSEQDILFRVRLDQLQQKLTQKVTEEDTKVSDGDIKDYYDKNKQRFAQPERRDLLIILTKTKEKADAAKQALESGQPWKEVAKKYSIDEASKAQGGKLPGVAKGQQEKSLDTAVFGAEKGVVSGPVKTQFGWYVFEVTKVTPASQQSLDQSKEAIKNLLKSQKQQKSLDDWIKDFRERYKDDTDCASDYEVAECKNGPEEKTNTGAAASGGAPNQTPQAPSNSQPAPSQPQGEQPQQ
jgi:foldase protein PrsA